MAKKRLIRVLVVIILSAVVISVLIRYITSPIAERIIRSTISVQPIPGHTVDFESVRINPYTVSGSIINLRIKPDSLFYADTVPEDLRQLNIIDFEVEKVSLRRLHLIKLFFANELIANKIIVKEPKIQYTLSMDPKGEETEKDTLAANKTRALPENAIQEISIGKVEIREGNFSMAEFKKEPFLVSEAYSIILSDIDIISDSTENSGFSLVSIPEFDISIEKNRFLLPGELYTLKSAGIYLNGNDSSLKIKGFDLEPAYDKKEFGWKNGFQTDRFDVKIETILCEGINLGELLNEREVDISHITIEDAELDIYRDKNVPFNYNRFPKLPHVAITNLKIPVNLDSLTLTGVDLVYQEVPEGGDEPGIISLNRGSVKVYNVSNLPEAIFRASEIKVEAEFMLQDQAPMNFSMIMPLAQQHGEFRYFGEIGEFELPILNPMIENAIKLAAKSGHTDKFIFNVYANNTYAEGTLEFQYHDLHITVLKDKEEDGQKRAMGFISDLANLAVRQQNPTEKNEARIALLYWERDMNKGVVNLMVKPLIEGIITTIKPGKRDIFHKGEDPSKAKRSKKVRKARQ